MNEKSFVSPPFFLNQPPPPLSENGFNLNSKVSPSILLIIIILAIIFFISGLLHLLVRFLLRPPNRDPDDLDSVTALQGQLQQLFNLHDAGVDQSYIDTLPIFSYKAIIGVKDPFDCAVCLCEFEGEDKLRLLPKCSHAFHMECIDTWLLSHSTCPLCRASLVNDFPSGNHNCSPIVFVLESGSNESSREIVPGPADREHRECSLSTRVGSHLSSRCGDGDDFRRPLSDLLSKSCEIQGKEIIDQPSVPPVVGSGEKVVAVKLGKYKNVNCVGEGEGEGEGSSNNSNGNIDSRRCFSMGSFAYVMEENTSLHVPIRTPMKKQSIKKISLPLTPGHKPAMSECGGCDSRRFFNGGCEGFKFPESQNDCKAIVGGGGIKRESFSVSKIWLREKKDRPSSENVESSRRAFSFRFPLQQKAKSGGGGNGDGGADARRTVSEIGINRWENGGSEWGGCDEEIQSCNSLDSQQPNAPSFARRTLLWLMGKQNKVVHSTFSSNV